MSDDNDKPKACGACSCGKEKPAVLTLKGTVTWNQDAAAATVGHVGDAAGNAVADMLSDLLLNHMDPRTFDGEYSFDHRVCIDCLHEMLESAAEGAAAVMGAPMALDVDDRTDQGIH